ncbi:hypothetical protein BDR03DRAFT_85934 [Suillus americanus]|nr:hypothetical protein BDR03DRAFT_85934 [Suillus americanus]
MCTFSVAALQRDAIDSAPDTHKCRVARPLFFIMKSDAPEAMVIRFNLRAHRIKKPSSYVFYFTHTIALCYMCTHACFILRSNRFPLFRHHQNDLSLVSQSEY